MYNLDNDTLLGKAPIPRAVAAMAIPSVISSLVTVVYNMADTFFVGQTGDALQVAAVSLTNPIFILLMAFANMFGMGGSAMISVALGENNHQSVKKISSFISWASLIVGAAFAAVLLCFTAPILHLFGADASTFEFARGYTVYIAFGAPFVIWSAAASFVVRAEGASKEAMIGSMIGTIANIVLDPIFVSGLGQGAAGAAIATTIGNMLAALYYLWYFLKKSRRFSLVPKDALCGTHIAVRVCSAGFPTAIFSALMCVSTIVLNLILVVYGNAPVAAIGIVFKANMFITFLQMGLANGVQPIFGYSYGAGDIKRFADTERFTKLCCFVVGLAATALYFFLRKPIIGLFVDDSGVITYGVQMLIAYMLSGPFIGFLFVNMNCMQSVGRALPATVLSVLRQGLLLIPLLYLLNAVFGLMAQFSDSPSRIMSLLRCRAWFGEGFGVDWNSVPNRKPYNKRGLQCRPLFSLSKKYYFNFYASCGSTHKIEFAKQIHKKSGRVPDFLYKGRKNVPVRARFFFSTRSKAWFRARGCSENDSFSTASKRGLPRRPLFLFTSPA